MSTQDLDKAYVSPYDIFLFGFDATHEKTASQLQEIKKNARIARMRDDANYKEDTSEIWKDF